ARLRGGSLERRGCRGKNRSSREGGEETMASHAKTPSLAKIQLAPTCFVRPGHEKCQANAHYSHSALRRFAAWRMRPDIQDALNGARFASLDPRDNYAWSPSMVSSKAKPKSKSSAKARKRGRGPRASWKGQVRCGLVSFGVQAFNASAPERGEFYFHQLHAGCHQRIRHEKVCPVH